MQFDAFESGVKPGGLRDKSKIKILICYLLSSIDQKILKSDIIKILQEKSLANYFELSSAFSELESDGSIKPETHQSCEYYAITNRGKLICEQLELELPLSIREQALSAILNFIAQTKRENENTVTMKKLKNGYNVTCNISGGTTNLMSFTLYVPSKVQAEFVKKNFHKNPEVFYQCMIALATCNRQLINEALGAEFQNQ